MASSKESKPIRKPMSFSAGLFILTICHKRAARAHKPLMLGFPDKLAVKGVKFKTLLVSSMPKHKTMACLRLITLTPP